MAGQVATAEAKAKDDPSLENQINLATWRIMLGEMATEQGERSDLWSLAVDQIEFGRKAIAEIEAALAASPEEERLLSKSPNAAMRLDATRVRMTAIQQREATARQAERDRLNQLREIAKKYRDVLAKIAEVDLYLRLDDMQHARSANLEALQGVNDVLAIARSRDDIHLFHDEPQLEDGVDLKAVNANVSPLSVEMIAHIKAIQALASSQLALRQSPVDQKLLEESRDWALAALNGTEVPGFPTPAGSHTGNPIGLYVLGLVSEAQGVEQVRPAPASLQLHQQAETHFAAAKENYAKALSALVKNRTGAGVLAELEATITAKIKSLESPAPFLAQADQATLSGRPEAAWKILQEGSLRIREPQLWSSMIEAGRRGAAGEQILLAQVAEGTSNRLLVKETWETQLLQMKIALDAVGENLSQIGAKGLTPERRQSLSQRLTERSTALRGLQATATTALEKAETAAFLALAVAYQSVLGGDAKRTDTLIREAQRLSRDAMAELEAGLKLEKDPVKAIPLREALIASRLAYGHISIRALPDYRDDASLAFAAAFDEMAKLPFAASNLELLGSPTISAMMSRDGDSATRLALEERRYRELVTRFLEGMFTLHFGSPDAASQQMANALQAGATSQQLASGGGPVDASAMLGQTDGFDSQVTLQDSVRAFAILASIQADKPDEALVESVRLLNPASKITSTNQVDEAALDDALDRIQSPLVGYAFASAVESYSDSLNISDGTRHEMLAAQARLAFEKVDQQLQSRRLRNRYPHLVALVEQAASRLGSIEGYQADATQKQRQGDADGAIRTLEAGLKRHPRSSELWVAFLEAQLEQSRRGAASRESYVGVLKQIETAHQLKMISSFEHDLLSASLLERMNELERSLDAYQRALAGAADPRDVVRTRSKISEVRIRLVTKSTN
ncbi:hypothetical protein [Blastopirellula marina]|uniref:hypothetical protein n=1 Tax=Blastopirellula marina TaxID=124 RepID=UPI0002DDEC1D|nr:hypothetical protein [Blastopirellula marina]